MGTVFLGLSPGGYAVAVKVIHPELARDQGFRARFRHELAAAQKVSGAYTAAVIDADCDGDPPWLATAFVAGPSLAEVVAAAGPLPEPAVWRLAAGLAEALAAVHRCGLVHRDLKPANVLLAGDGPRVIDFGISRALEGTSATVTGHFLGTPSFTSPEQAGRGRAGRVGRASDVFALGCVLAFAATGILPFGDGIPATVLYRVVHEEPDLGGLGGPLRVLVAGCLAKDPAGRPSLAGLESALAAHRMPGTAFPASFWPGPVANLIRSYQPRLTSPAPPDGASPPDPAPSRVASPDLVMPDPASPPDSASGSHPATAAAGAGEDREPGEATRTVPPGPQPEPGYREPPAADPRQAGSPPPAATAGTLAEAGQPTGGRAATVTRDPKARSRAARVTAGLVFLVPFLVLILIESPLYAALFASVFAAAAFAGTRFKLRGARAPGPRSADALRQRREPQRFALVPERHIERSAGAAASDDVTNINGARGGGLLWGALTAVLDALSGLSRERQNSRS